MSNPNFIIRDECPVCVSKRLKTIYQSSFTKPPVSDYLEAFYSPQGVEFEFLDGATYYLYECDTCGLIFQGEIPGEKLMERLYERWIDPQKALSSDKEQDDLRYYTYYAQEIMRIIAYFKQAPSSLSFFDFGMGWGKWALMVKAFGCDSSGSELSETRIQFARSNGLKVIQYDEISGNKFDFINADQVFEHIPDPLQTLCYLKTALKPNGLIRISVPIANDIERRLRRMDWKSPKGSRNSLNPVAPLEHINFFRRKSLLNLAKNAGMEEVLMPMNIQYKYTVIWGGIIRTAKNIILPIYRNILKRQNCIYLRNIA